MFARLYRLTANHERHPKTKSRWRGTPRHGRFRVHAGTDRGIALQVRPRTSRFKCGQTLDRLAKPMRGHDRQDGKSPRGNVRSQACGKGVPTVKNSKSGSKDHSDSTNVKSSRRMLTNFAPITRSAPKRRREYLLLRVLCPRHCTVHASVDHCRTP
jgi:hypothetical protein